MTPPPIAEERCEYLYPSDGRRCGLSRKAHEGMDQVARKQGKGHGAGHPFTPSKSAREIADSTVGGAPHTVPGGTGRTDEQEAPPCKQGESASNRADEPHVHDWRSYGDHYECEEPMCPALKSMDEPLPLWVLPGVVG